MKRSGAQTIFSDVTLRFRGGVRSPSPEWKCSSVYLRNPFPNGEREREGERWAVLRLSRPSFTVKTRSVGTWTPAPLSSPAWRAPRQHRRNLGCVWTPAMAGRRSSVVSLWPPAFTQFNGRAWGAALEYISKDFTSQKGLNVMAWRTFLFEKFDLWTFFFFFFSPSVPCRDVHGRSVSQSHPDCWSPAGSVAPGASYCPDEFSMKPRSPTPDPRVDTEGYGTA